MVGSRKYLVLARFCLIQTRLALIGHDWGLAGDGGWQRMGAVGQLDGQGEEVLVGEPFLAAAQAPAGEVLPGDGAGVND